MNGSVKVVLKGKENGIVTKSINQINHQGNHPDVAIMVAVDQDEEEMIIIVTVSKF